MGNISNMGWAGKGALLVKTRNMTKMNFLSLYALWHPVNPAQANYESILQNAKSEKRLSSRLLRVGRT